MQYLAEGLVMSDILTLLKGLVIVALGVFLILLCLGV
jgi:hypothetical protein